MKQTLAVLAAAGMLCCAAPARAEVYGPPVPVVYVPPDDSGERILPLEERDEARERATSSAWRKFWIAQGLAATDIAMTCTILADGGREINPLLGRNPSCGKLIAVRSGIIAVQYFLVRHAIRQNPERAGKFMNVVIGIQGIPVVWNAIQLAK
jgi:hypothetical protein